jgi:hypothetical protein
MSLFIGFVSANQTAPTLERMFEDTFAAAVSVRFSKVKKNQYGVWYKSATIEVHNTTSSFNHFLSQVKTHGNNTFIGDGVSYKVQFSEEQTTPLVQKVPPRIM